MKVISIFNQKGGVGKTTTNINLSAYLAMKGYKVLTIDIDPQGNTTSGLGVDKKKVDKSVYDVITSDCSLKEAMITSELISNLFLVPSSKELSGAEVELITVENRESVLKSKISKLEEDFDYIFIDCPPSLGFLSINSLAACDSVIIPIQCEYYALEGVSQLINTIQLVKKSINKKIKIEGVIMTMNDNRNKLCNEVISEVKKYFKANVYDTYIPRNIRLAEAPSFGLPVILYDEKCKGSEAYERTAEEFLSRQKEMK